MSERAELIHRSIMRDLSDGVMTIERGGVITTLNPAAARILGQREEELVGRKFAACFFEYAENDAFLQVVLDAVYDRENTHESVVPYFTGEVTRQLHVTTSFLHEEEEQVGIIVVLRDITELNELRDALKAMERIKALNSQLELRNKLLSETFGRFLSDEIVRQLLETPDGLALGGKKRSLTVMMSDLRGFTAMSERMDAQSLISMLNHYLGEMTEVISAHGGTIIEFIGDGIMAIYGAPAPSETHAADAVAAAVEMQSRMEAVNAWNRERGYPHLEMGIGVNTGEVIVGNIGSVKRTKYGVVGSHVNLCGRIESYTVGGQVLIAPTTRALIAEPLDIAGEQEVRPKGVDAPLVLSQIVGIGGKYNLSCRREEQEPIPLKKPVAVRFAAIREKHTEAGSCGGEFAALCPSEGVLCTEAPLERFDNLQMEAGGKLFCKVMEQRPAGWLVRFTAFPDGFEAWYRDAARENLNN